MLDHSLISFFDHRKHMLFPILKGWFLIIIEFGKSVDIVDDFFESFDLSTDLFVKGRILKDPVDPIDSKDSKWYDDGTQNAVPVRKYSKYATSCWNYFLLLFFTCSFKELI